VTLLSVERLGVAIHGRPILEDVSLGVEAGEVLGIIGESGSGKSMTALAIMSLLPRGARAAGRIALAGADLLAKREAELCAIRGRDLGMIFQEPMTALNPLQTIGDQVAETVRVHRRASRAEAAAAAGDTLDRVGLGRVPLSRYPHELSGGQRQRVVIAMAVALRPRLLIADEPTTSLDLTIQAQYLKLLSDLQREHGLALIFITHNLGIVAKMCDNLAVMYAGRVVEYGPVSRVFNDPVHPYTRALLNSIPRMTDPDQRLTAIEGQPPDLSALPSGCSFAPRCPNVMQRCRDQEPPAFVPEEGRGARCWLAESVSAGPELRRVANSGVA
jgi:oligopeptide/dipeptide ABC transporter ATP-binding protein